MARKATNQGLNDAHSGYVAAGSTLTGRLRAPGPFHVNGTFTGEILSEDRVSVGTDGNFDGTIVARKVVVEGGGRITGKIQAEEVQVRAGGMIAGAGVRAARLLLEADGNAEGAVLHIHRNQQFPPVPAPPVGRARPRAAAGTSRAAPVSRPAGTAREHRPPASAAKP